jgi:hypothetical protein
MNTKTNRKTQRQVITLNKWNSLNKKKVDPHFAARAHLTPEIASYISECVTAQIQPQLFITAWKGNNKSQIALGLAIPYEYDQLNRETTSTLEDLFEWQD